MFITAGLLNMLLKHFRTTHAELSEVLVELKYDYTILQNPTAKIDADILGVYLEYIVKRQVTPESVWKRDSCYRLF